MSYYTRLSSTDAQEKAIAKVERAFKKANTNISGATTIGKSPQTVILDVYHNDSKVYIDSDGIIKIEGAIYHSTQIEMMATKIEQIKFTGRNQDVRIESWKHLNSTVTDGNDQARVDARCP